MSDPVNPHKASHTAQAAAGSVPPTNTAEPAANLISPPIPAGGEHEAAPISPHGAASPLLIFHALADPEACKHLWAGWREFEDGRGGEQVCQRCNMGAMTYSLRIDF